MKKMIMPVMLVLIIIAAIFVAQGVSMHNKVLEEEKKFHELQEQYFSLSKAERDGAATKSGLNQQLVEIQKYPSSLMELKLIGLGKMLIGIFVLLLGILVALVMMPKRLSIIG